MLSALFRLMPFLFPASMFARGRLYALWLRPRGIPRFTPPASRRKLSACAALAGRAAALLSGRREDGARERLAAKMAALFGRADQAARSPLERACVYSSAGLFLARAADVLDREEWDALLHACYAAFGRSRRVNSDKTRALHPVLLAREAAKAGHAAPDGIFVYETRGQEDIREHLLPRLRQRFAVRTSARAAHDPAHGLAVLAYAARARQSALVLASNSVLRTVACGRKVVQLWHGMGLMKKVAMPGPAFAQDYAVISSPRLIREYARIFRLPPRRVLPLGCAQTDIYFDREAVAAARARFYREHPDTAGGTLCLFAPTFRRGDPEWYRCGWDYARLDQALEDAGARVVFRSHHVFDHIRARYGRDTTDLRASPRRFVRPAPECSLFELLCACDVFMTDYSSAVFYALLLDKPLIFYAPDLEEYRAGPDGLEIDYEASVPGPIVRDAAPDRIVRAFADARGMAGGKKYRAFKEYHAGACDGLAGERILAFLGDLHAREKAALFSGRSSGRSPGGRRA